MTNNEAKVILAKHITCIGCQLLNTCDRACSICHNHCGPFELMDALSVGGRAIDTLTEDIDPAEKKKKGKSS